MTNRLLKTAHTVYKGTLSFVLEALFGKGCRYYPTCSQYAIEAIEKHGIGKGTTMAFGRILRCHPFADHGYDPVK